LAKNVQPQIWYGFRWVRRRRIFKAVCNGCSIVGTKPNRALFSGLKVLAGKSMTLIENGEQFALKIAMNILAVR
jgi:hypothetical protein